MPDALRVIGLDKFDAQVKAWLAKAEGLAEQAAVGLANEVLHNVLINSPQYSGDYAASWRMAVDHVDTTYEKDVIPGAARWGQRKGPEPFGRGDKQAIRFAWDHNADALATFKLGQTIYISNSATHEEPYAWLIEDGKIKLRAPNMGAWGVGSRALHRIASRYSNIQMSDLERMGKFWV